MTEHELDDVTDDIQWVDTLVADVRETTKRTADGMDELAGQVVDLGGCVSHLATTVAHMAETVARTKESATDARHGAVAMDWFWRRCKAVLAAPRRLATAGAVTWVGFGSVANPVCSIEQKAGDDHWHRAERLAKAGDDE